MTIYDLKTMQICEIHENTVVALGTFDGCHEGHRAVFGQAIRSAGQTWEYGKISDCAAQGGNVYASKNSVINLYEGAEIRGGYSNQHGGNVFITTSTLNMLGGKIKLGKN